MHKDACDICQLKTAELWVDLGKLCITCDDDTKDEAFNFEVESMQC